MVVGPLVLASFGARGDRAEFGVALGCASHGLGTAMSHNALEANMSRLRKALEEVESGVVIETLRENGLYAKHGHWAIQLI
jgi:putative effector of murein hydrolase